MATNDQFQKAFEKLHASPDTVTEVLTMKTDNKTTPYRKKRMLNRLAAAVVATALLVGSGGVAYAMDIGGIQRTIQVWINGEQTTATFTAKDGAYTLTLPEGEERHGGGVAFNEDGSERPLTEAELMAHVNEPEVIYKDDGRVILYYKDKAMDITDRFKNDVCYIEIDMKGKTYYMTIKYKNGYGVSPHGYIQPDEFN